MSYRAGLRRARVVFAVLSLAALGLLASQVGAAATKPGSDGEHKITICHRTDSYTNPYVIETVDVAAVDGVGHDDHSHHTGPIFYPTIPKHTKWGDIIPGILNWSAEGQAILANGCKLVPPPGATTTAPPTTVPEQTTAPGETTTAPGETTTAPGETTTAPGETTTAPGETTTLPEETTTLPGGSTASTTSTTFETFAGITASAPKGTVDANATTLPRTGADALALASFALVSIGAGTAFVLRSKRRARAA